MALSHSFLLVALATCVAAVSNNDLHYTYPALNPKTAEMFDTDYPDDVVPSAKGNKFPTAPYPALQSTDKFHADLTEDSNTDGGQYDAQMAYDILRAKMHREQAQTEEALDKLQEEDEELEKARDVRDGAMEESEKARKEADKARAKIDEAKQEADRLAEKSAAEKKALEAKAAAKEAKEAAKKN